MKSVMKALEYYLSRSLEERERMVRLRSIINIPHNDLAPITVDETVLFEHDEVPVIEALEYAAVTWKVTRDDLVKTQVLLNEATKRLHSIRLTSSDAKMLRLQDDYDKVMGLVDTILNSPNGDRAYMELSDMYRKYIIQS